MTQIYSLNGATPAELPFRIIMPDGFTRTDPASFTEAEIAAAGYVAAPAPPDHDPATEHAPEWDGEAWSVTPLSEAELEAAYLATIPQSVTRRQAKRALLDAGIYDAAETAILAAGTAAVIDWQDADTFRRDNPLIEAMRVALGLTSEQVDQLFVAASIIE